MENYQAIFLKSPMPMLIISNNEHGFEYREANMAFINICKDFSPDKQSISSIYQHFFENSFPGITNKLLAALNLTNQQKQHTTVISASDQPGSYEIENIPVLDELGKVSGIIQYFTIKWPTKYPSKTLTFANICERLFEFKDFPFWIYEQDTLKLLYVNDAVSNVYGYTREELLQMNLTEIWPKENIETNKKTLIASFADEQNTYPYLMKHITRNGEYLSVKIENKQIDYKGKKCRLAIIFNMTNEFHYKKEFNASIRFLEAAQQLAHLGYWTNDLKRGKIYWSDEMYSIFETDKNSFELTIDNIRKKYHPEDHDFFPKEGGRRQHNEGITALERRIFTGSGNIKWVLERVNVIKDDLGNIVRLEGIIFDIDILKSANESLKKWEDKYWKLFNANPFPSWIYDMENDRFVEVNEAACNHYGYTKEEFSNLSVYNLCPTQEDKQIISSVLESIVNTESHHLNIVFRHQKKNGEIIYVKVESVKVHLDQRNTRLAVVIDVTELIKHQEIIAENNRKLKAAQEIARLGYWSRNLETGQIHWTDEMFHIFDFNPGEFEINLDTISSMADPDDNIIYNVNQKLDNSANFPLDLERRIITKSGKEKWIFQRILVHSSQDKPVEMEGVVVDITERKKTENALVKKTLLLDTLNKFVSGLLGSDDWLYTLDMLKETIGYSLGIDRIYYYELSIDPETNEEFSRLKSFWVKDENDKPDQILFKLRVDAYKESFEKLAKGETVISHIEEVPPGILQETLKKIASKVILAVPIKINERLYGIISFHKITKDYVWEEDEVMFLESMVMNITTKIEKKIVQAEAESSKNQLESLIRNLPGISLRRKAGKNWPVVFVNDEIERITGYSALDVLNNHGISWEGLIHPDDAASVINDIKSIKPGDVFNPEFRLVCKDGSIVWLKGSARAVVDKQGNVEFVDGVMIDITELHNQQQLLLESNERFKMVISATKEAIIDWNIITGKIVWGKGFTDVFGYDTTEFEYNSRIWCDNVFDEDKESTIHDLYAAIDDPQKFNYYLEYRFIKSDKSISYVQHRILIQRDNKGKAIRAVFAMMDVTDTMIKMNEIKKQNDALREIAWTQSHVVRRPLANLLSLVDLLKDRDFTDISEDFLIDNINDTSLKLDAIIHDIIDKAGHL